MTVSYRALVDRAAMLKDLVDFTMRHRTVYEQVRRAFDNGERWFSADTYELWAKNIEIGLQRAATTAITEEGVSLLIGAASQLPTDLDLFDMRPAVPEGFLVFPTRQDAKSGAGYDALWWHVSIAHDPGDDTTRPTMNITSFAWTPPSGLLPGNSCWELRKGHTLQEGINLATAKPEMADSITDQYDDLRRIVAFNLLAEQRVLRDETREASRSVRRRAERRGRRIDLVRLTHLPRLSTSAASGSAVDRDYTHRWVVNGHWRNQWYPSTGSHRPKWIAPYIKGPDDKPLVVKDDRFVFDPRQDAK